jgi:hypothetical protein
VNADTLNLIISLLSGFITALIGITPPGLLNMTAAEVNKKNYLVCIWGSNNYFPKLHWLYYLSYNIRPDIVILLREIGFGIFGALTVYFFVNSKKTKIKSKSIKRTFFFRCSLGIISFFLLRFSVYNAFFLSYLSFLMQARFLLLLSGRY